MTTRNYLTRVAFSHNGQGTRLDTGFNMTRAVSLNRRGNPFSQEKRTIRRLIGLRRNLRSSHTFFFAKNSLLKRPNRNLRMDALRILTAMIIRRCTLNRRNRGHPKFIRK